MSSASALSHNAWAGKGAKRRAPHVLMKKSAWALLALRPPFPWEPFLFSARPKGKGGGQHARGAPEPRAFPCRRDCAGYWRRGADDPILFTAELGRGGALRRARGQRRLGGDAECFAALAPHNDNQRVMAGFVPAIHVFRPVQRKTWMPG